MTGVPTAARGKETAAAGPKLTDLYQESTLLTSEKSAR